MPLRIPHRTSVLAAAYFAVAVGASAADRADAMIDFDRDVRPILSENCFHCHGPDSKAREADLRLDTKEGAYRTLDGITVVKPGDPAQSDLIERIFSDDKDDQMPPRKSHRTLTEGQKQMLKRWVEVGAPWGEHWAFVAPKKADLPVIKHPAAILDHPIDRFIGARLEKEGLGFSPEADRAELIRRVTLDLTGLPPTLDELDAFLVDESPDAYEKLVDRLLASPRYGERMVWEWLDAARYADTNGYQGDPTRAMWYWRDWAIGAFNKNMPFDQFTIEQLAGDLLPEPTQEQLIATGFHRNLMINGEGGRIAEESRVEYVMDRTETTGTVWMGLTFNCCRCHDHKFDPLKQSEYYQLSAYFNSVDESGGGGNDGQGLANPTVSLGDAAQEKKAAEFKAKEGEAKRALEEMEKTLRAAQPAWEAALLGGAGTAATPTWRVLKPYEMFSVNGTELKVLEDGSIKAGGASPERDEYSLNINSEGGSITAFKIEALPDDDFKNKGPGRAEDAGNFVLSEITLQGDGKPVDLGAIGADFEQGGLYTAKGAVDGDPKTGWAIHPKSGEAHTLILEARNQVGYGDNARLSFRLIFDYGQKHTLGRFKLSGTTDNRALLRPTPDNIFGLVRKPADQRTDEEKKALTKFFLDTSGELAAARENSEAAGKARKDAENSIPRTMVMRDRAEPRETFILVKGAYDKPADKVTHGTPSILPPLPANAASNRLALARWLVSAEHPLTARVTVNRLWQQFFGRGLVGTSNDFGVQGAKPTHPELLDWLAVDFREHAWDVKRFVRILVTSATYRQSSKVTPQLQELDPENLLLARSPRHRLPSWMLRDQALAASGLIVEKLGGPPVKVYQPADIWEDATFGQIKYEQDHGDALHRRSLYIFWRRIVAPTLFFDNASRQQCEVKSGRTNTPLHALVTLNDVTYVEAARALAQRMIQDCAPEAADSERIALAFRLCTARQPAEHEMATLLESLVRFRREYAQDPEAAAKLITIGESKPAADIPAPELAAHTSLALLLLNLDETLSKE